MQRAEGAPIIDDATLDKPCARKMGLATQRRSGKHQRAAQGINPISPARMDGECRLPRDYRLYNRAEDGRPKMIAFER